MSACNSVSASLAISLLDAFSLTAESLVEMVGPTVSAFKGTPLRVALCATVATIDSRIYQNAFHMIGKEIQCIAIPELAGAIENGASDNELESIVKEAFPQGARDFDVLILACTHYPIAEKTFRNVLGDKVILFDPASSVAERVEKQFWPREVGDGTMRFLISQDSERFRSLIAELFPEGNHSIEVIK